MQVTNAKISLELVEIGKPEESHPLRKMVIMKVTQLPFTGLAVFLGIPPSRQPGFHLNILVNKKKFEWGDLVQWLIEKGDKYTATVSGTLEMVGPGTPLYQDQPKKNRPKDNVLILYVSDINFTGWAFSA